ncbi:MAG: LCP family protein [Candidatus Limnocylindria bacterium]
MQRTSAIVVGLLVVVVAVVIGVILFNSGSPPEASPSPSASPSVAAPSAEASFNAELLDRRWTVLYVGTDQNEQRSAAGEQLNTDALMLVSLSADQSKLTLVSLPRDSIDIPLADGGTWDRKINGLYRERGINDLVGAMEALYGVPIDAHVLLDMDDFARLVDAVDEIEVSPPEPVVDPIVNLDLAAGDQTLDGGQTLGYVRTRVDKDYGRMGRQQEVLVSLISKFLDPETDVDLRAVLDSLDSLETDLPLDDLPTLLELARRASTAELQTLVIQPPLITFEGDRNDGRGYVVEPDIDAIREEVQSRIGD